VWRKRAEEGVRLGLTAQSRAVERRGLCPFEFAQPNPLRPAAGRDENRNRGDLWRGLSLKRRLPMRFLRTRWSRLFLPMGLIKLCLNISSIRATEPSHPAVVDADEVDLAKVKSGGRIVFVSCGPRQRSFHAIDDDRRTTFRFSNEDLHPTMVVELAGNEPVYRICVVPGTQGAQVAVYLLNKVPRNPGDLAAIKPTATIVDLVVAREAALEFAPQRARYVALQWTQNKPLISAPEVAEISAFMKGDPPRIADALAATVPPISLVLGPPLIHPVSP